MPAEHSGPLLAGHTEAVLLVVDRKMDMQVMGQLPVVGEYMVQLIAPATGKVDCIEAAAAEESCTR